MNNRWFWSFLLHLSNWGEIMRKKTRNFDRQVLALAIGTAICITLTTFPVVGYHYWQTLSGFALLAIFGLGFVDFILWYCAYWTATAASAWIKYVSFAAEIALAMVMIMNAAIVLYVMRGDRVNEIAHEQAEDGRDRDAKRFQDCLKAIGDRRACKELIRSAKENEQQAKQPAAELIPEWYL